MKKAMSFLLAIIIILSSASLTACTGNAGGTNTTNSESIRLTTSNFNTYFSLSFSVENCRLKFPNERYSRSLCDLKISIDSKTEKRPENVKVTIRFETSDDRWAIPADRPVITTKTIEIPYSASAQISIPLETWTTFYGVVTPDSSDFSYVVVSVEGSIK